MTITWQTIISVAAILAAIIAIVGYYNKGYNFVLRQKEQDKDIAALKKKEEEDNARTSKELTMIVYALSACLDGLEQLGANHTVPVAKDKLDKYINQQAHDQL